MDSKKRKRFVFESDTESAATCHACRKRFRWNFPEDEEYDGNDNKVVHQRNLMHSKQCDDLEPDERESPVQKPKFELTASQREKGADLANPDPWDPPRTDREDLAPVYKGWGHSPPRKRKLVDLNREPDDQNELSYLSDQATEKV